MINQALLVTIRETNVVKLGKTVTKILANLNKLNDLIAAAETRVNREANNVQIIAVTKEVSVERTQEAIAAGLTHLGENRPEGLNRKLSAIQAHVNWHYIGSLQTRKVKQVINSIDYLHSLDRLSLAEEIEKRAVKPVKCFIQVNVSGEESKHGLSMEEVLPFVESLKSFTKVEVVGLMTMAPNTEDEALIRTVFKQLKQCQQQIAEQGFAHAPCTELSMGMSNDFEIAVEEGATFVRVGTALVGNERGEQDEHEK
ncbi:MAG: YggS family pyridoxal phosphate-dependent enzyme [Lysinibacillus fusiformis]|nr:YggS family pyridoxal phosphate-dependent enzyme [Lysinibacillus fusiformis]MCE4043774.1 YggS family pyridoxal phosphate-dependent enzyme [Lysinibacillus fusiformis]MCK1986785.1 YggS family pyridoxal phosphate-dependent enzyme [Lysinibacillus fusiformis]MCT6816443.1 YggS family pyridoxal phosphate-dependent enzyme [Lysinibacillus fusiformis]MCT6928656.1 YggS family pyridoxal phosphate-dependent enzyme [Lysinibacillus fusiformis]MCT6933234.1 YggS family pyridoxal phosphate-dependent enzyme [